MKAVDIAPYEDFGNQKVIEICKSKGYSLELLGKLYYRMDYNMASYSVPENPEDPVSMAMAPIVIFSFMVENGELVIEEPPIAKDYFTNPDKYLLFEVHARDIWELPEYTSLEEIPDYRYNLAEYGLDGLTEGNAKERELKRAER